MRTPLLCVLASAALAATSLPATGQSDDKHDSNVVLKNDVDSAVHGESGDSRRVVFADVDADGDADLFVLNYDQPNELYLLQSDGSFAHTDRLGDPLLAPRRGGSRHCRSQHCQSPHCRSPHCSRSCCCRCSVTPVEGSSGVVLSR